MIGGRFLGNNFIKSEAVLKISLLNDVKVVGLKIHSSGYVAKDGTGGNL